MKQVINCAMAGYLVLLLAASSLTAEDWSRFRGPNGSGVSTSVDLPVEFGPDQNLARRLEIGKGTSSPIVHNGRLYVTTFDDEHRTTHCLDAVTGEAIWSQSVLQRREEIGTAPYGPATCTPAASDEVVVSFFPDSALFCSSVDGDLLWEHDLGPFNSMHGMAGSPVIVDSIVFIQADQLTGSFAAAYDLRTGNELWRVERLDGLTAAYSTAAIYQGPDGALTIVANGPHEVIGYRMADGDVAWSIPGITNAPISLPLIDGHQLYVCEPVGTEQPISLLRPLDANRDGQFSQQEVASNPPVARLMDRIDHRWGNGDGVVNAEEWDRAFGTFLNIGGLVAVDLSVTSADTEDRVRWSYRRGVPYVSSPVLYDDVIYMIEDGGIFASIDVAKGTVHQRGRLDVEGRQYYASLVAADGRVYAVDTDGVVSVIRADGEWEVLATNQLHEACYATPAIADGRIYIRTDEALYCFAR